MATTFGLHEQLTRDSTRMFLYCFAWDCGNIPPLALLGRHRDFARYPNDQGEKQSETRLP